MPTNKEEQGKAIIGDIAESILQVLDQEKIPLTDVEGAGMGVPGPVMPDGYVEVCVNLGWRDKYPARELRRRLKRSSCKMRQ